MTLFSCNSNSKRTTDYFSVKVNKKQIKVKVNCTHGY